MTWILFWKVFFVLVMIVFALMSILVTVFGAKDIKRLLKALGESDAKEE